MTTLVLAAITLLAGLVLIGVLASTVRALATASANSRLRPAGVEQPELPGDGTGG